jgi:hypothetical protein
MTDDLAMWIVYDHPADFPDGFIARKFHTGRIQPTPTDDMVSSISLDTLRAWMIVHGLVCLARDPSDQAHIVESWL